jgi:hypothetical protein
MKVTINWLDFPYRLDAIVYTLLLQVDLEKITLLEILNLESH